MNTLRAQLETLMQKGDINALFKVIEQVNLENNLVFSLLKQEFVYGKEGSTFYQRLHIAIRSEIPEDMPCLPDFEGFYTQYLEQKPAYEQITDRTRLNRGIGTSELIHERSVAHLDEQTLENLWKKKLVMQEFQNYQIDMESLTPHERLLVLHLAENGHLFKGTFLALGKPNYIYTVCPTAIEAKLIYFKGNERTHILASETTTGSLIQQYEKTMFFLRKHIPLLRDRTKNEDEFEVPMEALREFVVNAFVHRNYSYEGKMHIYIEIYDDWIDVRSPGHFPKEIDLQNINLSMPVNSTIMSVFYLHDYMERMGSGIKKAQEWLKMYDLEPATITQNPLPEYVCVRIPRKLHRAINFNLTDKEALEYALYLLEKRKIPSLFALIKTKESNSFHVENMKQDFLADNNSPKIIARLTDYVTRLFQKNNP